jgi:sigma-E factor negative regulatory protein RseA
VKKDEMQEPDMQQPRRAAADDAQVREQLSAWLDGELPEAEARFLLRRLEHDAGLRQAWARMQLAAGCMRNQPLRLMDTALSARIVAALDAEAPATALAARRGRTWHWAVAASVAALAVLLAPRFGTDVGPDLSAITAPHTVPSLAAADLVSHRRAAPIFAPAGAALAANGPATAPGARRAALVAGAAPAASPASRQESPMPLDAQSPADFPLVQTGQTRWPRSQLAIEGNDPALEAYLVRHNQMIASDGLSGFVPYVDVVASGNATDAAVPQANDGP